MRSARLRSERVSAYPCENWLLERGIVLSSKRHWRVIGEWRVGRDYQVRRLLGNKPLSLISLRTLLKVTSSRCLRCGSLYAETKSRSRPALVKADGSSMPPSASNRRHMSRSVAPGSMTKTSDAARFSSER